MQFNNLFINFLSNTLANHKNQFRQSNKAWLLAAILGLTNLLPFYIAFAEPQKQEDLLIGKTFMDNQVDKMLKKFSKQENPVDSLYEGKKPSNNQKPSKQVSKQSNKQTLVLPVSSDSSSKGNSSQASSSQTNKPSKDLTASKNSKQKNSITIEDAYTPEVDEKKATFSPKSNKSKKNSNQDLSQKVVNKKKIISTNQSEEKVQIESEQELQNSSMTSDQSFQQSDKADREYAQDEDKPPASLQAETEADSPAAVSVKAPKGEYFNDDEEVISKKTPEAKAETTDEPNNSTDQESAKAKLSKQDLKDEQELKQITKSNKKNKKEIIDTINFIQPSLELSQEDMAKVDLALSRSEQEQLTILWRSTLERNKTIHFIVEKLTPDDQNKKKNQVLSQILNTAIFLPFYALQAVAPADTSGMASYLGAGLASDLINGKAKKNGDHMLLSQTEMVIMFMMIDQVAERLRNQFHLYKQEKIDETLAQTEMEDAQREAVAALEIQSPASQFLSQVRVRQIEREIRRIKLRMRSNRLILVDLCGNEAVTQVDELIGKEINALVSL